MQFSYLPVAKKYGALLKSSKCIYVKNESGTSGVILKCLEYK